MSNYATKIELIRHLLLKKTDLSNLEFDVDKLYIDKLKKVPSGLSSLKSTVDKLDIDELKNVPSRLSNIKNKVDQLDIDQLKSVPSGLSSLKSKVDKFDIDKLENTLDDLEKKFKAISSKKLTKDLINKVSIFNGSEYFSFEGLQNYLVFNLIIRNSVPLGFSTQIEKSVKNKISSWKSTGLSREKIINPYSPGTSFSPEYDSSYEIVTFRGICSKQKSLCFFHKKVVNLFISYTLDEWSKDLDTGFTQENCLFGAVKLTKYADPDK